jgi:hypothetical protein
MVQIIILFFSIPLSSQNIVLNPNFDQVNYANPLMAEIKCNNFGFENWFVNFQSVSPVQYSENNYYTSLRPFDLNDEVSYITGTLSNTLIRDSIY